MKKISQTKSVNKDVHKLEHLCTAGRKVNGTPSVEIVTVFPPKIKHRITI